MPMITHKLLAVFTLLIVFSATNAQTVSIQHKTARNCQPVNVAVTAAGFTTNMAAVTMYIDFDPAVLTFESYTAGTLTGWLLIGGSVPGRIGVSWTNFSGAPINGTMFTLTFGYLTDSTDLVVDEAACEFTSIVGLATVYPVYNDGSVKPIPPPPTIFVDAAVSSSGDGSSWATALKTIGEATALLPEPGAKVLVKPGTYNESVTIKTSGSEVVPATPGVTLSDTNKIQFPTGTDLGCADPGDYPGEFYAYVYRSWRSNNGYYKVTQVVDSLDYVIVDGASFIPESGPAYDTNHVMAAIGRPVIYRKDPDALETQRVIINISSVGGATRALYVGNPISGGATDANPSNYNIIEGFDLTGGASAKALHIQSSNYNVFAKGKIYQNNGPGAYINGNATRPAEFNIIQNNVIYNTPFQGILVGYTTPASNNNHARFNHILGNEIYQSGTGTLAKFNNAILVSSKNESNVVERNHIRDLTLNAVNQGALMIGSRTHYTLVYNNLVRNVNRLTTGIHAYIMIADSIDSLMVMNNVLKREVPLSNSVYGFRVDGTLHHGTMVAFNTISNVSRGIYLEDLGASVDVKVKNNIFSTGTPYIQSVGTTGRFTFSHNNFPALPPPPYGGATGQVIGSPLFISPSSESAQGVRPGIGSPCLAAGTTITGQANDYLGLSRSSPPAIGAFEEALIKCVWQGTKSTDWDDPLNWDCDLVPSAQLQVIIPATTNSAVISKEDGNCKSIEVKTGGSLTIQSPYQLIIHN